MNEAIPELANLIIVGLLFFLIFGLMAVSFFKGTFNGCLVRLPLHFKVHSPELIGSVTTVSENKQRNKMHQLPELVEFLPYTYDPFGCFLHTAEN